MSEEKKIEKSTKRSAAKLVTKKQHKTPPVKKFGRGKRYVEAAKLIDKIKLYSIDEAIELLIKGSTVKFDATAEVHIQTGLDPKRAEQNVRDTVLMPAGLGKTDIRILVFAEGSEAEAAKKAGADYVGSDDLIKKIELGWFDFDIAISTPELMARVGKLGKTLGTKGLMPNPKSGTVTKEPVKAVKEFKKGKIEFKLDKDAIIHIGFGKLSLGKEALKDNFMALYNAIVAAKPASIKGVYIKGIFLASTMGPGIKIDLSSI